jgi:recombination protein RecT
MATQNSLAKRQDERTQPKTFSSFLSGPGVKAKINEIVGAKGANGFMTSVLSAVSTNPMLAQCEFGSILNCAFLGEGLKLSPSPQLGYYYMIPFDVAVKDRNGKAIYNDDGSKQTIKKAQFVLGYKGYIQLAIRSGCYKKLNVIPLKESEVKLWDPLNETIDCLLIEDMEARELTQTAGYYAMFEQINGFKKAVYWSKAQMEQHADKYSKAFSMGAYKKLLAGEIPQKDMWKYSSYWYSDFDGMACKTMLRQLISKWGIMSVEMQRAFESDESIVDETGAPAETEPIEITPIFESVSTEQTSEDIPAYQEESDPFAN